MFAEDFSAHHRRGTNVESQQARFAFAALTQAAASFDGCGGGNWWRRDRIGRTGRSVVDQSRSSAR
jgi:hypothetical protein